MITEYTIDHLPSYRLEELGDSEENHPSLGPFYLEYGYVVGPVRTCGSKRIKLVVGMDC